jgi:hypothetical protein
LPRALPTRYVPSSGFGYPLDGFLPASPCRFCFAPAALMGFTLRSLLLSRGNRGVSTRLHPPTVSLTGIPCAETQGRLGKPRFLGFDPLRSPWRPSVCLARQPLDAPLGFSLLGPATKTLARISPGLLSRAFPSGSRPAPAAPQSITRPSFRPLRRRSKLRSGRGQPFEGSCTGPIPFIRANATRAMCSPCEAYRIAAAGTRSLGGNSLYRSCRDRLRCRVRFLPRLI